MHPDKAGSATLLPAFCFLVANYENLNDFLDLYPIYPFEQPGAEHNDIFSQETRQEKPEGVLLSQLHVKVVLRPKTTKKIIIFFFGFQNYVN